MGIGMILKHTLPLPPMLLLAEQYRPQIFMEIGMLHLASILLNLHLCYLQNNMHLLVILMEDGMKGTKVWKMFSHSRTIVWTCLHLHGELYGNLRVDPLLRKLGIRLLVTFNCVARTWISQRMTCTWKTLRIGSAKPSLGTSIVMIFFLNRHYMVLKAYKKVANHSGSSLLCNDAFNKDSISPLFDTVNQLFRLREVNCCKFILAYVSQAKRYCCS
ncbi:hypothetical protein IFM89_017810 [Coptis chinensis]|uniref:Uncharacterized protein n=1 Tax=Coptis chinensis TaxID=261450 RepID=A0A835H5Y5_9MAGN|nr:hypothetical protein IFM89_017810 [Coptis chinensis]